MKMETNIDDTSVSENVLDSPVNAGNFSSDAESFPYSIDELKNLTQEQIRILFTNEYELCLNANYQNLPLCQTYNLSDQIPYFEENHFEYAFIVELVVPIIFGIVVLVGVFGNSLVVIVIIVNKQMRSTTNYLIFSLAIADLLFTVFCVPFTASDYIFSQWPFGSLWCKVVQYLIYVTAYVSVYTLLLLSLDRYLAVVHPIYAISIRTERNAVYAIIGTWLLILTSCIPLSIIHGVSEEVKCKFMKEEYHQAAFHIVFITTMYFIPLTVIVGLYLMILQRLWSQSAPGCTRSAESVRGKKRVTRMVVIVVVTFIICWLPIQIVFLLKLLDMYEMTTFGVFFQIFGQVLAYINSCINPILYAFLSDPFRKAFHKVISCGPNRKSPKGRIAYEAASNSRPLDQQRQSVVFTNLQETVRPLRRAGTRDRRDYEEDNGNKTPNNSESHLKLMQNQATTTTSFINGSMNDESPCTSHKSMNCVV